NRIGVGGARSGGVQDGERRQRQEEGGEETEGGTQTRAERHGAGLLSGIRRRATRGRAGMGIGWMHTRTVTAVTPRSRSGSDRRTAAEVQPRLRSAPTKVHIGPSPPLRLCGLARPSPVGSGERSVTPFRYPTSLSLPLSGDPAGACRGSATTRRSRGTR